MGALKLNASQRLRPDSTPTSPSR